jgi:predicted metal-dependent phosphoesterase TrpH
LAGKVIYTALNAAGIIMFKNRVFFEKPNLALFDSMGLMSVDMHFHTNYSDSFTRVQSAIKKAARRKVHIAITDHNEVRGCQKAYNNTRGVMIIPGIEVSCSEGAHVLMYFYSINELTEFYEKHLRKRKQGNPYLSTTMGVAELLETSRAYNCIRTAAHPFGYAVSNCGLMKCLTKRHVEENVLDRIDAFEVICAAMNRRLNQKALQSCLSHSKGFVGGSDGHTIFELGNVVTSAHADTVESFLNSIVKKKNYVIGTETSLVPKLVPSYNMLGKHMRYAFPTMRIRYNMSRQVKEISDRLTGKTKE